MDAQRQALIEYLSRAPAPQRMPTDAEIAEMQQRRLIEQERARAARVPQVASDVSEQTGLADALRAANAASEGDWSGAASQMLPLALGMALGPAGRAGNAAMRAIGKGRMKGFDRPDFESVRIKGETPLEGKGPDDAHIYSVGDEYKIPGPSGDLVKRTREHHTNELDRAVGGALEHQPEIAGTVTREVAREKGMGVDDALERLGDRGKKLRQPNVQGRRKGGQYKKLSPDERELVEALRRYNFRHDN